MQNNHLSLCASSIFHTQKLFPQPPFTSKAVLQHCMDAKSRKAMARATSASTKIVYFHQFPAQKVLYTLILEFLKVPFQLL